MTRADKRTLVEAETWWHLEPLKATQLVTGELLRGWLEKHRWTPAVLAESLGVTERAVEYWLNDTRKPAPYLGSALNWIHARMAENTTVF